MIKLIILLIVYLFLFFTCFALSKNVLITPQFLFLVGFIMQVIYAFGYVNKYEININQKTFAVFILGAVIFVITSLLVSKVRIKIKHSRIISSNLTINCENWKLVLFIIIQLAAIYVSIRNLRRVASGSLMQQMYAYRAASFGYNSQYSNINTSLPLIVRTLRRLSFASGFVWGYLLVYSVVNKNKENRLLLIANLVLSMLCDMLLGGRKGSFQIAFAMAFMYYIMRGNSKNWRKQTRLKTLILGAFIGMIVLLTFSLTAQALGRQVTRTNAEYLSTYLAAPIKNLDLYVTNGNSLNKKLNYLTLPGLAGFLRDYLHIPNLNTEFRYPYNRINGYTLGNAYTIYYAFLFDHGVAGVIVYTFIMALIAQKMHMKALNSNKNVLDISLIFYGFIIFGVFLAFFDNSFYINLVSIKFAEYYVFWLCFKIFFSNKICFSRKMKRHYSYSEGEL